MSAAGRSAKHLLMLQAVDLFDFPQFFRCNPCGTQHFRDQIAFRDTIMKNAFRIE